MRTYDVIESIKSDLTEQVRYLFTTNDLPADRDALIENLRDSIHESVDNALIYTSDIMDLWEDAGRPEPYELGMADTIETSISYAVYEYLLEEAEEIVFDAADEALADLQSKILDGDITYSWSEATADVRALREAEDPEDIFDALYNFRGQVDL